MKLHILRQIAPYPNNSLAQSPSKLIRSHAGDWIGGRHLSYSRIRLPNADHSIIQSAQNQQSHYPERTGIRVASWPLAAHAQQPPAMPVIAYLNAFSAQGADKQLAAFLKGLGENGYVEGRNVAIEYRWGYDESGRLPELAADRADSTSPPHAADATC